MSDVTWERVGKFEGFSAGGTAETQDFRESWAFVDVFDKGMREVKRHATKYIPPSRGQGPLSYSLFIERGYMPPAVNRTITFLKGLILSRDPIIRVPKDLEDELENVSVSGGSMQKVIEEVVGQTIKFGCLGVRLAWSDNGTPKIKTHDPRSIEDVIVVEEGGEEKLVQVVLFEKQVVFDKETKKYKRVKVKKTLFLDKKKGKDVYSVRTEVGDVDETIQPKIGGKVLDFIPFVVANFNGGFAELMPSPVEPVAEAQKSYLQTACVHRTAQGKVASPFPVFAGFTEFQKKQTKTEEELLATALSDADKSYFRRVNRAAEESGEPLPFNIGSESALRDPSPEANAYYMEVSGEGLSDLANERVVLKEEMASFTGRMLAPAKQTPETATEVRERGMASLSLLGLAAKSVAGTMRTVLVWYLALSKMKDVNDKAFREVAVDLVTRYITEELSPEAVEKLLMLIEYRIMSKRTYYSWLKAHGGTRDGVTFEQEQAEIESEGFTPPGEENDENR